MVWCQLHEDTSLLFSEYLRCYNTQRISQAFKGTGFLSTDKQHNHSIEERREEDDRTLDREWANVVFVVKESCLDLPAAGSWRRLFTTTIIITLMFIITIIFMNIVDTAYPNRRYRCWAKAKLVRSSGSYNVTGLEQCVFILGQCMYGRKREREVVR